MVQNHGTKSRSGPVSEPELPALPSNCYRTPHGYVFRVVVPEPLRATIGKREIKKSLGKDYREAVSQARLLALQVDKQFADLQEQRTQQRQAMDSLEAYLEVKPSKRRLEPITKVTPELVAGLKSLWLAGLEADLDWRKQGLDDEDYDDLQANIAEVQQAIAKALARGQPEPFLPVVHGLLAGRGYLLAVSDEEQRQLALDVLPALQQGYDLLEQRQAGRLVEPPKQTALPLRATWEPAPSAPGDGLTWQQLLEHWLKDRERPAKTTRDVETYVTAITAFLPQVSPAKLTRAQVTEWLRNERETRSNSAKTLEKKGTLVGALFSVAVKDEMLEKNPFAGFDYKRFAAKEGVDDNEDRDPFTMSQIARIFSSDEGLFSPGVVKASGGGGYHARVWISLLSFLSGARIDELSSLLVSDIQLVPVPYMHIRRGKNQNSVRDVPIHPRLIELGFLDYVAAIHKAGHETLWPLLRTKSEIASPSEVLGKWFNPFIHNKLGMPGTVVFHSFRHTFKDLCRDALIPRDLHQALTGHAKETTGDEYGKGFSLDIKFAEISKIKLDLLIPTPMPYGNKKVR